jgi:tRNA A-37 threonylcarbamoyl transferase component Bud32
VTEPPTDQPTLTGQRLIAGRYRLRRVIGRGSMGIVWLAYDEVLHRQVAVKEVRLPAGMPDAEASDARERTLREARAIAALTHPNVVAVYDVAKHGVEPFVVMELMRGRSLAQLAERNGTLNTEQTAVVADAIAAGLDLAHRRGITHRDVKPGNVLIGEDGQVKLTDFGISRNVSEVTMTSSGMILGTPAYMAPEIASGDAVTTAADLWGFGATLFAAVEGRPPYDAGDALATVNEVVHGEIPSVADDTTLAAPLVDVITGLMVKDPAQRMSLMEVRRRIRPLLPEPGTVVFPPDESEADAGPADNKPTTHLAAKPVAEDDVQDAPPLAAAPGPLPWAPSGAMPLAPAPGPLPWTPAGPPLAAVPGPLPFARRPAARRRGAAMTGFLLVVAVVLFAAAAGGGFAATRSLAGQPILPARVGTGTTSVPHAPPVRSFTTEHTQAAVGTSTAGGDFTIAVPTGWTRFAEQRGPQAPLPISTAVRWVKSDGTAELTVERFPDYAKGLSIYLDAVRTNDNGTLLTSGSGANTVYLWRSSTLNRDTYFSFVSPADDDDLWVVSVTVPVEQEDSGLADLFDKIRPSFQVSG